tara:strand:- start:166 stop:417 length:252 start_codon:yes stop_codon:yes gene_type:complete
MKSPPEIWGAFFVLTGPFICDYMGLCQLQEKTMDKEYLKNFKDGVADALLNGNMAEEYSDGYKQGYDFGLTMYQRLSEENGDE